VHLPQADYPPVEVWRSEFHGSYALRHDLLAGPIPWQFAYASVLYAELPWKTGFDEYNDRAQVDDDRTWRQFLAAVSDVITDAKQPAVVLVGPHAVPYLPDPDQNIPVILAHLPKPPTVRALVYRTRVAEVPDNTELLTWLAGQYSCIGDFCCGYGWSGRIFAENGGTFVLSDYNPRCIGYIAAHGTDWHEPA
jgi:hypothetical protein